MEEIKEEMTLEIKGRKIPIIKIVNFKEINDNEKKDIILKTCSISSNENNYKILRNYYLEECYTKYKPEELTDDGIPNIETQLREISDFDNKLIDKFITKKDIIYKREMLQRVKCLALDKMGKDYMINTNDLTKKERNKLQEFMHHYNDIDHEKIIEEFNNLVCPLLDDVKTDISRLPIYDI